MVRLGAIFIAICMVLIAGSLGGVLFLALKVPAALSAIAALAALVIMVLYSTVANRLRDRRIVGDQIADLSRGTGDLARQVAELNRRIGAMENRTERARGAADPMVAEISELGTLVKQLAETVAAHESEIYRRMAGDQGVPVTVTAAPVAPAEEETAPVAEAAPAAATTTEVARGFAGLTRDGIQALIASAVDANRIDLYLQPIVTLPQRKVRFYEAVSRLRTDDGDVIPAADFLEHAEAAGLMSKIDNLLLFRSVQVMRRLQLKNREVGLFCNVSPSTLADATQFQRFLEFMDANRALAPNLVFEFGQAAVRNFGPIENEALAALAERGFRFSMDNLQDLRIEPRDLNERSFKFVKVPAKLLLNRNTPGHADIHAADLADLLARSGIDLISERIESESMVVDLLDYDVRFGQGFLFSPPRPVRPEALAGGENVDTPAAPTPAQEPLELKNELVAAGGRR
ncbi:MAG TPA: EAL domain-containing protein [Pseudolabrys sp.]|nr:EAL domain-containing protein [Pseudolabrys sp.]